jgi:plasmid stabilization system protein ParE
VNRLVVSERAVADLERIGDDIALYSPSAAERTIARLEEITRLLTDFPLVGTARDEIENGMRTFPVGNYTRTADETPTSCSRRALLLAAIQLACLETIPSVGRVDEDVEQPRVVLRLL